MSDGEKPFVKFQGMSERKTPVTVKGDDLPGLIRELVKLIDSDIRISFDHHTTNVRNWENNQIEERSADELLERLEESIEDFKEGRTFTLEQLKEMKNDV